MHQVSLPNFMVSLHRIEQDSSADNGYIYVALVSSSTGGRVRCADKPRACVMFAVPYLTVYARKFQEKGTLNINPITLFVYLYLFVGGTAVAQWLRCCATNRKVAGSMLVDAIGFFVDIKSFRSHYGPGVDSTSNRNEYQEYFLGVKAAGA